MFKASCKLMFFFILCVLAGCGTVRQTKVRVYAADKPRVDQENDGNAGYLTGQPPAGETETKDTRRVYIMEFSAPAPEVPDIKKTVEEEVVVTPTISGAPAVTQESAPAQAPKQMPQTPGSSKLDIDLNKVDPSNPVASKQQDQMKGTVVPGGEYIVAKDDTLQKIAKKFYGSYSKWSKIYDANKDVIKNPDILVPGIKLRIPTE